MSDTWVTRASTDQPPTEAAITRQLIAAGLMPHGWGNAPGDEYGWHEHTYKKILYCVQGSIVFHVRGGDLELRAGDRLDLPPRTSHAATVGPDGVRCVEAPNRE